MAGKRLILLLDGTWQRADQAKRASNVVLLMRALAPRDADGVQQLVYYDAGVGTSSRGDRLLGGLTGAGLAANVREAYIFLGNNYEEGDEVYLFGFSRGAFTARSLAGFIGAAGLLGRESMGKVGDAWAYYRTPPRRRRREDRAALGSPDVPIRCVGVWDTVGALGIPVRYAALNFLARRHRFHDTSLGKHIRLALHAVAADERRGAFAPALWQKAVDSRLPQGQVCEQAWFPGCHSDVGGGLADRALSGLALRWMIERLIHYTPLAFQDDWHDQASGANPLGTLHESRSLGYPVSWVVPYQRVIAGRSGWTRAWRPRNKPDAGHEFVNECVHPSLLKRLGKPAPVKGLFGKRIKTYKPRNVKAAQDAPVAGVEVAEVVEKARATASNGKAGPTPKVKVERQRLGPRGGKK